RAASPPVTRPAPPGADTAGSGGPSRVGRWAGRPDPAHRRARSRGPRPRRPAARLRTPPRAAPPADRPPAVPRRQRRPRAHPLRSPRLPRRTAPRARGRPERAAADRRLDPDHLPGRPDAARVCCHADRAQPRHGRRRRALLCRLYDLAAGAGPIRDAARRAGIHDTLDTLPRGYDTLPGRGGRATWG